MIECQTQAQFIPIHNNSYRLHRSCKFRQALEARSFSINQVLSRIVILHSHSSSCSATTLFWWGTTLRFSKILKQARRHFSHSHEQTADMSHDRSTNIATMVEFTSNDTSPPGVGVRGTATRFCALRLATSQDTMAEHMRLDVLSTKDLQPKSHLYKKRLGA